MRQERRDDRGAEPAAIMASGSVGVCVGQTLLGPGHRGRVVGHGAWCRRHRSSRARADALPGRHAGPRPLRRCECHGFRPRGSLRHGSVESAPGQVSDQAVLLTCDRRAESPDLLPQESSSAGESSQAPRLSIRFRHLPCDPMRLRRNRRQSIARLERRDVIRFPGATTTRTRAMSSAAVAMLDSGSRKSACSKVPRSSVMGIRWRKSGLGSHRARISYQCAQRLRGGDRPVSGTRPRPLTTRGSVPAAKPPRPWRRPARAW